MQGSASEAVKLRCFARCSWPRGRPLNVRWKNCVPAADGVFDVTGAFNYPDSGNRRPLLFILFIVGLRSLQRRMWWSNLNQGDAEWACDQPRSLKTSSGRGAFPGQWRSALADYFTSDCVYENVGLSKTVGAEQATDFVDAFNARMPFETMTVRLLHVVELHNIVMTERIDSFHRGALDFAAITPGRISR
jgi:hypothetical protein